MCVDDRHEGNLTKKPSLMNCTGHAIRHRIRNTISYLERKNDNVVVQFSFVQNHSACELNKCKLVEIGAITYM